ncbi:MAG: hypothetical protein LLF83_04750 [Methanobacterium sp.]|nr:hypothetical protein [Methanobacterium sp.]
MDDHGYVMSGMSLLLILPTIILFMVFLDMNNAGVEENSQLLHSDKVLKTSKDFESNIPVAGKEVLKQDAENVVRTGIPLTNSRKTVKDDLQIKMDQLSSNYEKNTGLEVECNITSVDNSEDPFSVEINSTIYIGKDSVFHKENLSQDISLTDTQYPMPNPLPFIKCKNFGGVQVVNNNKIAFNSSLVEYLNNRGVENAVAYENATTSYIIKKCPYDPYIMHGNLGYNTLKTCIENGYFHESSDGSCFLCRMEGKGTCPHYGMETFILPAASPDITNNNSTNISLNLSFKRAPSSIDHVIFNDTPPGTGTYQGDILTLYNDGVNCFKIFLDDAHRMKYGIPIF